MTIKTPKTLISEFDAYSEIFLEVKRYRLRQWIYLALMVAFAFGLLVAAMQPPVVIVKDNIAGLLDPRIDHCQRLTGCKVNIACRTLQRQPIQHAIADNDR